MLRLKHHRDILPAGLEFTDQKTGKKFDPYNGLSAAITNLIAHRLANPKVFPRDNSAQFDPRMVMQEIFASAASKRPDLFTDAPAGQSLIQPRNEKPTSPCKCGANSWEPQYCPTCSGKRLIGFKCTICQMVYQ